MKKTIIPLAIFLCYVTANAQISAKLMKYVDISANQITFVYGGDIWVSPKNGGTATQLTHSPGEESWPRFSPDGREIAYTARYAGNSDVYVVPVAGGVPTRITYASYPDRMVEWHPDGKQLLIASRRETGTPRVNQFFSVDKEGGFPKKLDIPYGELASFSPDGNQLAYITKITENYPFKRYRGGLTSDVILYDLKTKKAENITNNLANDGKPAWAGEKIYFLSDQGEMIRRNIWSYDPGTKQTIQITFFEDFDITYLSAGPDELVFENGGTLYKMNLSDEKYEAVNISIISDLNEEMQQMKKLDKSIQNMSASPAGNRIAFEARGELFNVPVKEGVVMNITQSSGAFDHSPAWSPDGNHVAYWSDKSGEYEIYLQPTRKNEAAKKLTNRKQGFGYKLHWSPDSKRIAFIDEKNDINIIEVASGTTKIADNYNWNYGHGGRFSYPISWSPDSKYIAYQIGVENANNAIFIYDINAGKSNQVTSGFYSDSNPVFSTNGKYLFFTTNRNLRAQYSDMNDGTWIYPNSTHIAVINLDKDSPYLLKPKNDELAPEAKKDEKKEESKKKDKGAKNGSKEEKAVVVKIDWNDMESRLSLLPPKPGNIGSLMAFENKIVYRRFPNTGADGKTALMFFDLEKREEKKILDDVQSAAPTGNGKKILVRSTGKYGIIAPKPEQKIKDPIPTDGLVMQLNPREEWEQIFNDTWRRHRDFFYDENMQQVNWEELKVRYGKLLKDARTRWDISNLQSNLAAELSAGHTYTFGGDTERTTNVVTGYLGIDWEPANNAYRIKRIVRPAPWDTEIRSPFDLPGSKVSVGDYIHSVNGVTIKADKDPYAAFEGMAEKTVTLAISKSGNLKDAKQILVKCLNQNEEQSLRYLEWIESNRKLVEKLSDGQLGYIYMSNTAGRGQLELVRMYYGQLDKKGFIIDERFNGGGQLADRFLELLKRPVVYNLYWRHGKNHTWPVKTNTGPMGMLINGWAGSGGDGLPWAFQELKAGPIVGERTLGILVGPATGHRLIDGGGITVPGARLYDNDGHWFWEGEGVKPDFPVWDDPNILMQDRDPQMEKVVQEVLKLLKDNPPKMTPPPAKEDRTAKGIGKN